MLLLNRQFRRLAVRGELDYDAGSAGQGSAVSLTAEMPRGTNVIWSAGINTVPGGNALRYQLGYETSGRTLGARVLSGYQPGVGPSLSVSLSLGMSREPLWPFGHGLSYTTFKLDDLRVSPPSIGPAGQTQVSVQVTNTGARAGDEVVQVYLRDVVSSVTRPVKELRRFERVTLKPGEKKSLSFTLGPEDLSLLDEHMGQPQ